MITIAPIEAADAEPIRAFNARLAAAAAGFQFPARLSELEVPLTPGAALWTQVWVARDGERVCGGYLLKHERLLLRAAAAAVGNYQLPLSEGIVDRRYAMVGLKLTQHALGQIPALYSLGMGSLSRPLPKVLARLGWTVEEVPFFFRVRHGGAFAAQIQTLRARAHARALLDLARFSGVATLGALGWNLAARTATLSAVRGLSLVAIERFDERADQLLEAHRGAYPAMLDRGSAALNIRFPAAGGPRLRRFMVRDAGRDVGWLLLTYSALKGHKQFGDLRLGCVVDGLLAPERIGAGVALATQHLAGEGAELIVANQTHLAWQRALKRSLFVRGPSNFILARSPAFAPGVPLDSLHMNRGDGDGPINL